MFPLPEDAAVDHLRMRVGDRVIEGVIRERAAAKQAYEQAKQQGQRASLVEQERPNVFTTSVANIPPGAAVTIEIEYQQAVRYDAGRFRLRFPMVVGPRYIPGTTAAGAAGTGWSPDTDEVPDASRITPPVRHPSAGPINPVTLRVELDPGVPLAGVTSSYHAIDTTPVAGGRYEIELRARQRAGRSRLRAGVDAGGRRRAGGGAAHRGEGRRDLRAADGDAAGRRRRGARLPREVIFVVDHSGSMARRVDRAGEGGAEAGAGAAAAGRPLQRDPLQPPHRRPVPGRARPRPPERGRWPSATSTRSGPTAAPRCCRPCGARWTAASTADRLRQVIFLTDGAVGNEERLFAAIHERLGDSRLFTIGIGSAPNSHFMREAARLGRGTFTYIGEPREVKEKMAALFAKLESPALADVRLELPGAGDAEIVPAPIPDLYAGEPVIVALRAKVPPTAGRAARPRRRHRLGVRGAAARRRGGRGPRACTGRARRSPRCSTRAARARRTTTCATRSSTWRCATIW